MEGKFGIQEGEETWVALQLQAGATRARDSSVSDSDVPTLNAKQVHAINIVVRRAQRLDACRPDHEPLQHSGGAGVGEESIIQASSEPLRMLLAGTAGTGKTVVIKEMVRRVTREGFILLGPTGNAACGIGGQVRLRTRFLTFREMPDNSNGLICSVCASACMCVFTTNPPPPLLNIEQRAMILFRFFYGDN